MRITVFIAAAKQLIGQGENINLYEKMIQSCINHQQYHKAIQTIERSKSRYLMVN